MKQKVLSLNEEFGNNIFTRSKISSFFDKINRLKEDKISIDFSDIEFISRSCVDEYLKLKNKSNKTLIERKMSNEISSMFSLVENQQKNTSFCSEGNCSFKIPA